jgi:hypothetical protein
MRIYRLNHYSQPGDETDENLAITAGNWVKVFEYCESTYFNKLLKTWILSLFK